MHIGDHFIYDLGKSAYIVEIDLGPGLGLVDTNLYLYSANNGDTLFPDSIEIIHGIPNTQGSGDTILAWFRFPDSYYKDSTNSSYGTICMSTEGGFTDFFDDYHTMFELQAYCDQASGIKIPEINQYVRFIPNEDEECQIDCAIPLSHIYTDVQKKMTVKI